MRRLVEFSLEDGRTLVVEVDETDAEHGVAPASLKPDGVIVTSKQRFEQLIEVARPAAQAILDAVKDLGPRTVQVEFGVKMSIAAGAIIAASGAEANFKITCTWERNHATGLERDPPRLDDA